ncbi:MAG: MBOAT family protein [Candidatus Obscuribacterales bacterium]|nr:MBOAT family protein [Candidatus Obscuribacterales bacterium]
MLFNSISYFLFLPIVLCTYLLLPGKARSGFLLLASYFFYMSWMPQYGLMLFALSSANYFLALGLSKYGKFKKTILLFGLILNLGSLCYYKYAIFLLKCANDLLSAVTKSSGPAHSYTPFSLPEIILPLGISFFVFEFIHYLVDVYKGDKAMRNFVHFSLFAAFFPSQIAGPIKRFQQFSKQIANPEKLDSERFFQGLSRILQGLFKKVALADNLALIANPAFQNSASLGTADAWIATFAFTLQIYFDFSGYTDIGIGSAKLFGIDLPENFNLPYLAGNLSDFWKRWHISLSSWLRDYLFIPLGGSRSGKIKTQRNLLITMLLGGLWHGAAWQFVVWGGLHGIGLILNHAYDGFVEKDNGVSTKLKELHRKLPFKLLSSLGTVFFVAIAWVFFRAANLWEAVKVLKHMFSWSTSSVLSEELKASTLPVAFGIYGLFILLKVLGPKASSGNSTLKLLFQYLNSGASKAAIGICAFIAAIAFAPEKASPFIYFQF